MKTRRVVVLGAGIAGLTAAHELVERGFKVTVIEKHSLVGGMARTQWCTLGTEWLKSKELELEPAEPVARLTHSLESVFRDARIDVGPGWEMEGADEGIDRVVSSLVGYQTAWLQSPPSNSGRTRMVDHKVAVEAFALRADEAGPEPDFEALIRRLVDLGETPPERIPSPLVTIEDELRPLWEEAGSAAARWALGRTALVRAALQTRYEKALPSWPKGWFQDLSFFFFAVPLARFGPATKEGSVTLRRLGTELPGEHGYRYFPGFYRHVFDSMRRIPLFEERRLTPSELARADDPDRFSRPPVAEIESARTVMDNLVPTLRFAVAPGNRRKPLRIARTAPRSLLEVRRLLRATFDDLKVLPEDLARFQTQIVRYLTSCPERRATYEEQTWWSFLGADRMSPEMQTLVDRWPQALIGLRAREADARTIGTITTQLLLEQVSSSGFRDGTLNGPTSNAWLEPWRTYLRRRGVRFERGEVESLRLVEDGVEYKIVGKDEYEGVSSKATKVPKAENEGEEKEKAEPAYLLVLALSATEAQRVVKTLSDSLAPEARPRFPQQLGELLRWPEHPPADGGLPVDIGPPAGPLRHYCGIQFYLENDIGPPEGHIYFADSDYRLSAISQAQFWRQRLVDEDNVLRIISVLSVDIGDWHSKSRVTHRSAAQSTRAELAKEVWRQIEDGIADSTWSPPIPLAYHVDDDMLYGNRDREEVECGARKMVTRELPRANEAPYLVNLAGDWKKRPGEGLPDLGYEVMLKNFVLAGSYLRTHTRLATMESANESGRHAVNAILRHLRTEHPEERFPGDCLTWNPEEEEVDDLDLAKRIDQDLFAAGLPHALDILGVEELVDFEEPRGAPGDPPGGRATVGEELLSRALGQLGGNPGGLLVRNLRRLIGLFTGQG